MVVISTGLSDCYAVNDNFENIGVKSTVSNNPTCFILMLRPSCPPFWQLSTKEASDGQHDGFKQTKVVTFRNMTPRFPDFTLSLTVNKQRCLSRLVPHFFAKRDPLTPAQPFLPLNIPRGGHRPQKCSSTSPEYRLSSNTFGARCSVFCQQHVVREANITMAITSRWRGLSIKNEQRVHFSPRHIYKLFCVLINISVNSCHIMNQRNTLNTRSKLLCQIKEVPCQLLKGIPYSFVMRFDRSDTPFPAHV